LQPPEDEQLGSAAAIHYTWGTRIVKIEGGDGDEEEEGEEEGSERVGAATETAATTEPGKREAASEDLERLVWEFDKRAWTDAALVTAPPRLPPLPAWSPHWALPDGSPVSRELAATLEAEARAINRAIDSLKPLV